jgi:hypothetical protein
MGNPPPRRPPAADAQHDPASVSQPTPEIRRTAFIDESMRLGTSGGLYLVAAAVVIDADSDDVERQLRTAIGRRRHRIHWRNESDAVRLKFLDVLAGQPVQGISIAVEPTTARRQERARARAWWSLTWHLAEHNVRDLIIEARQEDLNRRDQRTLSAIQRAGIGTAIAYRFAYPSERPLLWAADALAGALSAQVGDGTTRYTDRLPASLTEIHHIAG